MIVSVHGEAGGRHKTSWNRSLAVARRPWGLIALAALVVVAAAIGFLAGHAAAPVRTAAMPAPATSAVPRPLVVHLPRATVAALPALRTKSRKAPKKKVAPVSHHGTQAPSTPAPSNPGYTIVGG
jgi:hypothetical protein